jgi:hypothetical protein
MSTEPARRGGMHAPARLQSMGRYQKTRNIMPYYWRRVCCAPRKDASRRKRSRAASGVESLEPLSASLLAQRFIRMWLKRCEAPIRVWRSAASW